jgi:hypothetical protein
MYTDKNRYNETRINILSFSTSYDRAEQLSANTQEQYSVPVSVGAPVVQTLFVDFLRSSGRMSDKNSKMGHNFCIPILCSA